MLRTIVVLLIAGMLCCTGAAVSWADTGNAATEKDEDAYLIGPGDVLDISVWKDESLTRTTVVRPDGYISFPLIGNIRAADRTASSLKVELEKKLDKYVPGVTLSLEIREVRSLVVYVIGRVNNPGRFLLTNDINVLQALASAGGLNPFANRNDIKIFRQGTEETTIFPFQYDEVVEGKRLEQNIYLRRGDVVVIP